MTDRVRHFLRIESGAARVGLSARTLHRAIRRGELTPYYQGARFFIDADELDRWALNRAAITAQPVEEKQA